MACVPPNPPPDSFQAEGTAILWLRNDLRLRDNDALCLASTARWLVPVYIFDERLYGAAHTSPSGFPRTGPIRARFISDSVRDLAASLRARGSELLVQSGTPEGVLADVVRALRTGGAPPPLRVVLHREIAHEEASAERAVARTLRAHGVECVPVWGGTLHHPADLPPDALLLPSLSKYRKRVERAIPVRPEAEVPRTLPPYPHGALAGLESAIPDLDVPGGDDPPDERAVCTFTGGETHGLARLNHYIWALRALPRYKQTRDACGVRDASTNLSAWLACGCVSARTVYWEAARYEAEAEAGAAGAGAGGKYWLVVHLMVRDYFRWVAWRCGAGLFGRRARAADGQRGVLQAWIEGRTGCALVDASMRELARTGYISNRSRQIVASYLINDLAYAHWRAAAEYFEYVLVDYDVASNWGNWASMAGAIPNYPRRPYRFDVAKQAARYDPRGEYVRRWCPERPADD